MTDQQLEALESWMDRYSDWGGILTYFHDGDCQGADAEARHLAKGHGWFVVSHPPSSSYMRAYADYDVTRKPKDYLVRDKDIVTESHIMLAAPNGPERRGSGTWWTINEAKRQKKPLNIFWPDGKHEFIDASQTP